MLVKQLQSKAFAQIPFSKSWDEFKAAADLFLDFCELSQAEKEKWHIKDDPEDKGIGYIRKSKEYGELDDKEYFHYFPEVLNYFDKDFQNAPEALKNLIKVADGIFDLATQKLGEVLKEINKTYPGVFEKFFDKNEKPFKNNVLRFLNYHPPQNIGDSVAGGHYDKSGITLALAESKPGLRIGFDEKNLELVEHKDKEAIVMVGLKLAKLTANKLRPSWHDAIDIDGKTYRPGCARWAVVFFMHPEGVEAGTFKEHHQPL